MYGRPLGSSFLSAKCILYPAGEIDGQMNPFHRFVLIYLFCAACFTSENHLNDLNVGFLSGFRTILWSYV